MGNHITHVGDTLATRAEDASAKMASNMADTQREMQLRMRELQPVNKIHHCRM